MVMDRHDDFVEEPQHEIKTSFIEKQASRNAQTIHPFRLSQSHFQYLRKYFQQSQCHNSLTTPHETCERQHSFHTTVINLHYQIMEHSHALLRMTVQDCAGLCTDFAMM